MSYNDDKRELLKLKQGLIEESKIIPVDEKGYGDKGKYEVKGVKNKIINFFYLYKIPIICVVFTAFILAFIIFSAASVEKEDLRVLMISSDSDICSTFLLKEKDYQAALEMYTPNYDGNDYIHVNNYSIDLSPKQDANYLYVNNTKLFSEISLDVAQIYIGDKKELINITLTGEGHEENEIDEIDTSNLEIKVYEDLSLLYPNDPHVVDKYFYQIKGTAFAEAALYENCPDNIYMVLRKKRENGDGKSAENHEKAAEVFDNIVKDNKVSEDFPKK